MAEAFARTRHGAEAEFRSATVSESPPATSAAGDEEAGVALSPPRRLNEFPPGELDFDVVIALCSAAAAACPVLTGNPVCVNWRLPDDLPQQPGAAGETRDRLRRLTDDLFQHGYIEALVDAKRHADAILDNISDGIIAHDLDRRVFYFNRAAERITEYPREEVLQRDCHEVFAGNYCGPRCRFHEDGPGRLPPESPREMEIVTRSGERRRVMATFVDMTDGAARPLGALLSFHDVTREHSLARRVAEIEQFSGIIGRDAKMAEVFELVRHLADSNVPVLIQGESGTGKELIAAAIHNEGPRANKLFVPVNCGALPESLLESELFGHVKGSFTGAIRDKKGRFELADGGTIFLDEIGDISATMQVKLLRVLQEGRFERVGGEETIRVDVRLISATNKNIEDEIHEGRFREDLFYRLNVVPLFIPPLRDRRNDIPLLIDHILARALLELGRKNVTLSHEALELMLSYDWPGNVRELQNWIQFALVKCRESEIRPEHLPPMRTGFRATSLATRRHKLDAEGVRAALREANGSKVAAARLLGVSRATLYRFLDAKDFRP